MIAGSRETQIFSAQRDEQETDSEPKPQISAPVPDVG